MKFQIKNLIIILSYIVIGANIIAGTQTKHPPLTAPRAAYLHKLSVRIDTLLSKEIKAEDYKKWTDDIDALIKEMEKPDFVLPDNLKRDIQKLKNVKMVYGKNIQGKQEINNALKNTETDVNDEIIEQELLMSTSKVKNLESDFKIAVDQNKGKSLYQDFAKKIIALENEIEKLSDENEKTELEKELKKFKDDFAKKLVKTYGDKLQEIGTIAKQQSTMLELTVAKNDAVTYVTKQEETKLVTPLSWALSPYTLASLYQDSKKILDIINFMYDGNSVLFSTDNQHLLTEKQKTQLIDRINKNITEDLYTAVLNYLKLAENAVDKKVEKDTIKQFLKLNLKQDNKPELLVGFYFLSLLFDPIDTKSENTGQPIISVKYEALEQEWQGLQKKLE